MLLIFELFFTVKDEFEEMTIIRFLVYDAEKV